MAQYGDSNDIVTRREAENVPRHNERQAVPRLNQEWNANIGQNTDMQPKDGFEEQKRNDGTKYRSTIGLLHNLGGSKKMRITVK
jgi:hypothetical protein